MSSIFISNFPSRCDVQKMEIFLEFTKMIFFKKLLFEKVSIHRSTGRFWRSETANCVLSTFGHLGAPKSTTRDFSHYTDVFGCSGRLEMTFGAFGLFNPVHLAMRVSPADGRRDGDLGSRDGLPWGGPGQNISRVRRWQASPPTPIYDMQRA